MPAALLVSQRLSHGLPRLTHGVGCVCLNCVWQCPNKHRKATTPGLIPRAAPCRCVVCGEGSHYLRYRVVPSCYRRHFPSHLKVGL